MWCWLSLVCVALFFLHALCWLCFVSPLTLRFRFSPLAEAVTQCFFDLDAGVRIAAAITLPRLGMEAPNVAAAVLSAAGAVGAPIFLFATTFQDRNKNGTEVSSES